MAAELFTKLQKRNGKEYNDVDPKEALGGKIVALYFSAHWCPPCKAFTPLLKDFYEQLVESNEPIEVVFLSMDHSEADMKSYMEELHGNWCVIPHGDASIKELSTKYEVNGIPALIVLKPDGSVINDNGRGDVQSKGPNGFQEWKEKAGL